MLSELLCFHTILLLYTNVILNTLKVANSCFIYLVALLTGHLKITSIFFQPCNNQIISGMLVIKIKAILSVLSITKSIQLYIYSTPNISDEALQHCDYKLKI